MLQTKLDTSIISARICGCQGSILLGTLFFSNTCHRMYHSSPIIDSSNMPVFKASRTNSRKACLYPRPFASQFLERLHVQHFLVMLPLWASRLGYRSDPHTHAQGVMQYNPMVIVRQCHTPSRFMHIMAFPVGTNNDREATDFKFYV